MGFIPLNSSAPTPARRHGFTPLEEKLDREPPGVFDPAIETAKDIGRVYPVAETAANFITQAAAMPLSGLAGLGAAATKAVGLTDADPADVVHRVGGALTYQPITEHGKHLTGAAMYPFEKLAEAGRWAGDKTLDASGSPTLATAVDTAINVAPGFIVAGDVRPRGPLARAADRHVEQQAATPDPVVAGDVHAPVQPVVPEAVRNTQDAIIRPDADMPVGDGGKPPVISPDTVSADRPALIETGAEIPETNPAGLRPLERIAQDEVAPAAIDAPLAAMQDAPRPGFTPLDQAAPEAIDIPRDMNPMQPALAQAAWQDKAADMPRAAMQAEPEIIHAAQNVHGGVETGAMTPEAIRAQGKEPEVQISGLPEDAAQGVKAQPRVSGEAPVIAEPDAARANQPIQINSPDAVTQLSHMEAEVAKARQALDAAGVTGIDRTNTIAALRRGELTADDVIEAYPVVRQSELAPENAIAGSVDDAPLQPPTRLEDPGAGMTNGEVRSAPTASVHEAPASPMEPSEAIRLNIERLGGMRRAAGKFKLAPQLYTAIQKAKVAMKSGGGSPEYFTRVAGMFKGKDEQIHAALTGIAEALEPAGWSADAMPRVSPETRTAGIAAGQAAIAPRRSGFTPLAEAAERSGDTMPVAAPEPGSTGSVLGGNAREIEQRATIANDKPVSQDMAADVQNAWAPGANYAPLVQDIAAPGSGVATVADLPAPLRREKILGEFAKDLGTTIYEGRVKGKNRLGFFRPGLQEVRIKRASDLEVAAHEIGHLLDDRVPAISNTWRIDKALREELRSISYDKTKVPEGYAEGVRLFLTQPDVLKAKAPKVYEWLDNFTNTHKYGPALRKAQEGMTGWFGQDALNRARSKIGEHKPLADYFDGAWDKFRQSSVDDLHGIYRMERDLKGGIAPVGAYETARLSRASHSIADGAIRFGAPVRKADGSFTFKGKGLEEILKPVAENLDDALLYFVGRSSRELQVQGREHLFTMGEVDAMLRLRRPEFETAFKEYQAFNKAVLDFAEAHGVINPQARRMWQRTQYLPFHRVGAMDGFKGKPGDWSGIKALTGGTTNIRDVLGNMVSNAAQLIDKSVKNEARQKVAALANETGGGRFMVKIDAETRPVRIDKAQVLDGLLKSMGIDRHAPGLPKNVQKLIKSLEDDLAKSPGMVELFAGNQPPAGRNVVAVLNDGRPTWYEVGDPVLYRALTALDRPAQHWLVKWLGLPKRIGQTTITLTPDFMVANIARDTIMGSVMSRSGFRPVMDSLQGMRMRMMTDPVYKDFIANGGGMSSIYLDEARFRAKLEKFYQRQGIDYRTVLDTPDKLLNAVETIADAFEMSTRLGEYKRDIEKGDNPRHAAYLGREVSTDFAMRGDSQALGFLYDTVIFLKAATVSMDRLYRGVAHDPNKGAIAAKAGLLALASAGLYLLNRDDPRYQDMDDWKKDTHWHFFVGDQHFMYPKIWEIGALASIAERTVEKTIESDPKGLGKDVARILSSTFSLNLMPQAIAPLAEQAANRNSFTSAPIETPGMENLQPFLRAKPGTSETMKAAGMATKDLPESMQVNPARAEALLRGYFNTWAMYGLMLTDKAFFNDKRPELRTDQLPVVRRFYQQEPPPHTKYETMFYDMLGEANRLHGTMKELDKQGLQGIADEKEKSPLATEAKPLGRAADNLARINADMREVRRSDLMPEEKRRRLDELTAERNALLKNAVLDSQKAQGGKQ